MYLREFLKLNNTTVASRNYYNSIIANDSMSIEINLDGKFNRFFSGVGIDDMASDAAIADFYVYADDKLVDSIVGVSKTLSNQDINVNIYGAKKIKLEIITKRPNNFKACWIDPQIYSDLNDTIYCPLHLIKCQLPTIPICVDNCIIAVLTNGMESYFDEMISSFKKHNSLDNTIIVVFGFSLDIESRRILDKHNVLLISCETINDIKNTAYKMILLSLPYIVWAKKYMYIDCDCLVCDDLTHLFDMIDKLNDSVLLACRHGDKDKYYTLQDVMLHKDHFESTQDDIIKLRVTENEKYFTGIINSGFFVTTDCALMQLNHAIQTFMPMGKSWILENTKYNIREEGIIILGLARTNSLVVLDESYNIQMHFYPNFSPVKHNDKIYFMGKKANVLHFTGLTKPYKYNEILEIIK